MVGMTERDRIAGREGLVQGLVKLRLTAAVPIRRFSLAFRFLRLSRSLHDVLLWTTPDLSQALTRRFDRKGAIPDGASELAPEFRCVLMLVHIDHVEDGGFKKLCLDIGRKGESAFHLAREFTAVEELSSHGCLHAQIR